LHEVTNIIMITVEEYSFYFKIGIQHIMYNARFEILTAVLYTCVKPSNTPDLLKPGYGKSLCKFIRTTCFGRYSTIIRSTKS